MQELKLQIVIDESLDSEVEGVVALGDFTPKGDNPLTAVYSVDDLHIFYRDLVFGRPFPLVLVTRSLSNMGQLLAVILFLHRDLAIHPGIPGLIAAVNLMDGYGTVGLAHVDRDLSRFLKLAQAALLKASDRATQQAVLETVVGWVRAYVLEGAYPALPPLPEPPRVVDRGTDGFVFAVSTHKDLVVGWEELYRQGFLRGVLMQQAADDRWNVLAARKSPYLSFDLKKAASILNEAEGAMGEERGWSTDGFWLKSPSEGTLILPSALLQVFLRI